MSSITPQVRRAAAGSALLGLCLVAAVGTAGTAHAAFAGVAPTAVATHGGDDGSVPDSVSIHAGTAAPLVGSNSTNDLLPTPTQTGLTYSWDFGDGTPATGFAPSHADVDHTYADAGVYTATLTVEDAEGDTDTDTVVVEVDDTAPVAAVTTSPTTAKVTQTVSFDASASTDAETADADLHFRWEFGDGEVTEGVGVVSTTHQYATAGTKTVELTVTDPEGAASVKQTAVSVTNTAPTASATVAPATRTVGATVTFDASASTDAETPGALTYDWDFGDGSAHGTDAVVTHVYSTSELVQATLTVTDPQGLSDTQQFTYYVAPNESPTAVAAADRTVVNVGQTVHLTGEGSSDLETPAEELTYSWDLDDGGSTTDATTKTTETSYSAPGSYTVTLTVTDGDGNTGTDTVSISVGNVAPTAAGSATPQPAYALQSVTFDGSASTDAETPDDLDYSWVFGDGTPTTAWSTSPSTTHVFSAAGEYTATLRVRDAKGAIDTVDIPVEVLPNSAPTAVLDASTSRTTVDRLVGFDGSGSSDPEQSAGDLTFSWDFGDGQSATGPLVEHRFTRPGHYTVTLTVTDPAGAADTATVGVRVAKQVACQSGKVGRHGSWRVVRSKAADGGSYCDNLGTGRGRDVLTLTFTGPRLEIVHGRVGTGGTATVIIDGVTRGTLDFHRSGKRPRFVTRAFRGLGEGEHTVKVVMAKGETGLVDGFRVFGPLP